MDPKPLLTLSAAEQALLKRACVVLSENLGIDDWEFETVVGLNREEVRSWHRDPLLESDVLEARAILGNVLGYPHGMLDLFPSFGLSVEELKSLLRRLEDEQE